MLRIAQIEELSALLLRVPHIVESQEARQAEFVDSVAEWLRALEVSFAANRLPDVAKISALRSTMMMVSAGLIPEGIEFRTRPSPGRVLSAAASRALSDAVRIVDSVLAPELDRVRGAQGLAVNLLAVIRAREPSMASVDTVSDTGGPIAMRSLLLEDGETASAFARLESIVGADGALVLLDQAGAWLGPVECAAQ